MHTFIKNLLNGQSVEWKSLGEVAELKRGRVMSKEYLADNKGNYPVYSSQTANNGEIGKINTFDFEGEFITWTTDGANAGTVFYRNGKFSITNVCGLIILNNNNNLNYKFIYHWLCIEAKKYVYSGMGNPKLMSNQMEKVKIPIPPLEIQQKIVQILDAFTAVTAELTAELNLRVKQYQYYRDKLLHFSDNVEWKPLGEVAERIYSGGTPKTEKYEYWENGTIPWMSSGEVNLGTVFCTEKFITEAGLKNSSAKLVPKNSIVIALAGQGKTRGKVARIRIDLTTNQSLASLVFDQERINPDYVYHFLNTQYENLRRISSGEGTRGGLNLQMISNYKIPIPPLETQTQIVEILDKFETLTHSISEGLPREIELRQKQYEYYRELLLGFE